MTQDSSGTRIESLNTANRILETVRDADGITLTELSRQLDAPESTVYHYLATLRECDYLVKEGSRYHVGLKFLSLGERARERKKIYSIGKTEVDKLARNVTGAVQIVVEEAGDGVYAYQSAIDNSETIRLKIGTRVDLHCSAAGKSLLAQKSDTEIEQWIQENGLPEHTENTITTPDRLFEEIGQVRTEELAYDDEEQFPGVRCVAAPVVSDGGDVLGALSVTEPKERMDDDRFRREMPHYVQETAGVIETNTAYSSWDDIATPETDR